MSHVNVKHEIKQSREVEIAARNIKHGTWVRIGWNDSEPCVGLFLGYRSGSKKDGSYPKNYKGECSMDVYMPSAINAQYSRASIVHTQVVEILDAVTVPE